MPKSVYQKVFGFPEGPRSFRTDVCTILRLVIISQRLDSREVGKVEKQARKLYTDTIGPEDISEELAPEIRKLGLEQNCRELAERGWTVVENV